MISRRKLFLITAGLLIVLLVLLFPVDNSTLTVSSHTVVDNELPPAFDGLTIVQLADLHNAAFGEQQEELIAAVRELDPDLIFFTGDQVDSRRTSVEPVLDLLRGLCEIAPMYAVTGNHEARLSDWDFAQLEDEMKRQGVIFLRDEPAWVSGNGESLLILGVDDPTMAADSRDMSERIRAIQGYDPSQYMILVSHRPELLDEYAAASVDLVFSGHAHGGQIRLPLLGGIYAPDQGFFPRYDSGIFQKNGTSLVVSRGLGNSLFPMRIHNPPEIVSVTLQSQ